MKAGYHGGKKVMNELMHVVSRMGVVGRPRPRHTFWTWSVHGRGIRQSYPLLYLYISSPPPSPGKWERKKEREIPCQPATSHSEE